MATSHTLKAEKRTCTRKLNPLRAEGLVPAVMYGAGSESINLQVNAREFAALLSGSVSEHILINLEIAGESAKLALLKDIQHNAISGQILHADFLQVDENTEIQSTVPVILVGEAAGLKEGGILEQHIHDIEVKCLSKDLPETIEVNISGLGLEQTLTIAGLGLPASIKPVLADDVIVAIISATAAAQSEGDAAQAE